MYVDHLWIAKSNGEENFLDYVDDWSILDESTSQTKELLEVLQFEGAWIGLKINVEKSIRLSISEDEKVTTGKRKWMTSLTLLVLLIKPVGALKG